jgi:hypothetical protein
MQAAVIAPTALLDRYCVTSYHLALAHMTVADDDYRYFYADRKRQGDFVIMDNSVIELEEPLDMDDLMKACMMVGADEIVLPDHPHDSKNTMEDAYEYSEWVYTRFPIIRQMAVPQGRDIQDWMECYFELVKLPFVDTIGIPKSLGSGRLIVMEMIDKVLHDVPRKEYHMLGTWANPTEIQRAANHYDWVRGVDSKIPVRAGLAGIQFHPLHGLMTERHQLPPLLFDTTEDPFPVVTQFNVNTFIDWAQGIVATEGVIPIDSRLRRHHGTEPTGQAGRGS